jgi:hypothetical protein
VVSPPGFNRFCDKSQTNQARPNLLVSVGLFYLTLAKAGLSGTIAGPHTAFGLLVERKYIALSHDECPNIALVFSRRIVCTLKNAFLK